MHSRIQEMRVLHLETVMECVKEGKSNNLLGNNPTRKAGDPSGLR